MAIQMVVKMSLQTQTDLRPVLARLSQPPDLSKPRSACLHGKNKSLGHNTAKTQSQ